MKRKLDFITNSSSTNYILEVYEDGLTAETFVNHLFDDPGFMSDMSSYGFVAEREDVIQSLKKYYDIFPAQEGRQIVLFGDEEGTLAGRIFDYCLRQGFRFDEFMVKFESCAR